MKIKNLAAAIIFLVTGINAMTACKKKESINGADSAVAESALFQCSMHPQIVRREPGKCPICHMELQRVEGAGVKTSVAGRAAFTLPAERRQMIGVTYGKVEYRVLERILRVSGRIAFDPELYSALEEYRQLEKTSNSLPAGASEESRALAGSLLNAGRMKLRIKGLSDRQIAAVLSRSSGSTEGLIQGPISGSAWIYADLFEQDAALIKPGQALEARSPHLQGSVLRARVESLDPIVSQQTRTVRLRALLIDPPRGLRPETYLEVDVRVPLGRKLAVPREAILDTGERSIVFVAGSEGSFEPREVKLGGEGEGFISVLSGLKEGESVVTSANFLIDSEAQFKAALEAFKAHGAHDHDR